MEEKKEKVVYLHKDKEGIVRYVGSGTIDRAFKTSPKSGRGKQYIEFVEANGQLEVDVVSEGLTKLQAEDLERELYYKFKETVLNARCPNSVKLLSKEMFDQCLYYDETSKSCLRWKVGRVTKNGFVRMEANSEAGSLHTATGYYQFGLQGKTFKAHRIVCVLHDLDVNGKLIDHIDRDKSNNRISNLRVVTPRENSQNMGLSSRNTTGVQGVQYEKHRDRWIATWYCEGKKKHKHFPIKNFSSSEETFQAAVEYRQQMVALYYNNNTPG